MTLVRRLIRVLPLPWLLAFATVAAAQDANITQPVADIERLLAADPLVIEKAEISRPKAEGDITLKAEVSFGGAPALRVKLRKAERGAEVFNNVPRYDLAAYELQKLFLDPAEYVVPPTTLRMLPLTSLAPYAAAISVVRTFARADQVLVAVQYWLSDIKVVADVYSTTLFETDPLYARHIGQLNILTYLIEHGDSNVGNFLIGRSMTGARVFSVDNGVAFASTASDRGELWRSLRVKSLPADAIERLRALTPELLQERLGVLAQWKLQGGRFVPVTLGNNLAPFHGVRIKGDDLQMGLTEAEIRKVYGRLKSLLMQVERGRIALAAIPVR